MTGENVYGRREEYLSLPGYEVPKDAMYLQTEKLIEDTFEKAGYDFVRFSEIDFGKIPLHPSGVSSSFQEHPPFR